MPQARSHAVQDLAHSVRAGAAARKSVEVAQAEVTLGIELSAAIIAVSNDEPVVRIVSRSESGDTEPKLPSGAFNPAVHASLEDALRTSVLDETGLDLGHIEQLHAACGTKTDTARVSIGYLALAHATDAMSNGGTATGHWQSWYMHFPWEDWRRGKPAILSTVIEPKLQAWIADGSQLGAPLGGGKHRHDCARMLFGIDGGGWDEEKVLERFDLLVEANLLEDLRPQNRGNTAMAEPLQAEHYRCLAMAMGRLRAKLKYRPVIFDLMPPLFTLFELQRTVEAILGPHLHKQNFRRLVEHMGLVEPTDEVKTHTGGRPAKLFRFRPSVMLERCQPGVRVRAARN